MQEKELIRQAILKVRDKIPPEVRKIKDRLIMEALFSLEEFRNAGTVFLFASFKTEVNTIPMIRDALAHGKKILLPKVEHKKHVLALWELQGMEELAPGYMGIPEPTICDEGRSRSISDSDLAIIPGAGFDPCGNRIGYGGGYYDRLLPEMTRKNPLVALAYEEQIADSLPAEPHDIKVEVIITDRRIIRCLKQS